ncbi:hypothetical protein [Sphingomonas koreensis]
MKRSLPIVLIAATTILATAGTMAPAPAQAQEGCAQAKPKKKRGLGGLMGAVRANGLIGSVAGAMRGDGNLRADLQGAAQREAGRGAEQVIAAADCGEAARAEPANDATPASTARPASETSTQRARREMAASDAKYPSRMTIPAEWKTAKAAYDEFGKVKCFGCEGGYAFSGWPDWPRDAFSGKYGGTEKRLSAFRIGHVHRWSSNGFAGTLTVNGEEQVNGFRCRKMTYRLEKGGKSAERPSLICWGKANEYAGSDSWVGVF